MIINNYLHVLTIMVYFQWLHWSVKKNYWWWVVLFFGNTFWSADGLNPVTFGETYEQRAVMNVRFISTRLTRTFSYAHCGEVHTLLLSDGGGVWFETVVMKSFSVNKQNATLKKEEEEDGGGRGGGGVFIQLSVWKKQQDIQSELSINTLLHKAP